ncbi:flagellar basal-body MS-ring/collar protein FliF [soil metagenome]
MVYREQADRLLKSLIGLGYRRLAALALIGLTVFAVVGLGAYYLGRPSFDTLYTGLDAQDVNRVGYALSEAGIPFDVNVEGNAILVPFSQTAKARMLLAEKGLPRSETAGYELFDNMGSLGLTSFMQEVTRVRVLEGEIARTIQSIQGVRAARVHIVMQDSGSFRRNQQTPSASVVLRTESDADFTSAQAIRHLVAAAVPGLTVEQVTVLNSNGTLLASGDDASTASAGKLVGLEKTLTQEIQDNIGKTLTAYLGTGNFQVSVAARLNTDKKQVNETIFDPESKAERSVRVVKESGTTQNTAGKAPVGADQNLPQGAAGSGGNSDQSTEETSRREEVTNFEMNSKTISTTSDGYSIENLAIAVVVNRDRLAALAGKDATPEQITAQTKEIEQLVASAAGFNDARGDKLKVTAVPFPEAGEQLEPVAAMGIGEQVMRQSGTLINGLTFIIVTVLVIWFGLRPAMRAILQTSKTAQAPAGLLENPAAGREPILIAEREPNLIEDVTSKMRRTPQKRLEQMIEYDDVQAAAILKQWLMQAKGA